MAAAASDSVFPWKSVDLGGIDLILEIPAFLKKFLSTCDLCLEVYERRVFQRNFSYPV